VSTSATFAALIQAKVGGDSFGLDVAAYVARAVQRYEMLRPRIRTEDIDGTGSSLYATPTGWVPGYSEVLRVEYPVDEVPPVYLDGEDFEVVDLADVAGVRTQKILLHGYSPASSSDDFRLQWKARHTVDATSSTIPANDEEAVGYIGAHLLLIDAATQMSANNPQGLHVDEAVATVEQTDRIFYRSKDMAKAAAALLGVATIFPEEGEAAGQALSMRSIDFDLPYHYGRGGLFELTLPCGLRSALREALTTQGVFDAVAELQKKIGAV